MAGAELTELSREELRQIILDLRQQFEALRKENEKLRRNQKRSLRRSRRESPRRIPSGRDGGNPDLTRHLDDQRRLSSVRRGQQRAPGKGRLHLVAVPSAPPNLTYPSTPPISYFSRISSQNPCTFRITSAASRSAPAPPEA